MEKDIFFKKDKNYFEFLFSNFTDKQNDYVSLNKDDIKIKDFISDTQIRDQVKYKNGIVKFVKNKKEELEKRKEKLQQKVNSINQKLGNSCNINYNNITDDLFKAENQLNTYVVNNKVDKVDKVISELGDVEKVLDAFNNLEIDKKHASDELDQGFRLGGVKFFCINISGTEINNKGELVKYINNKGFKAIEEISNNKNKLIKDIKAPRSCISDNQGLNINYIKAKSITSQYSNNKSIDDNDVIKSGVKEQGNEILVKEEKLQTSKDEKIIGGNQSQNNINDGILNINSSQEITSKKSLINKKTLGISNNHFRKTKSELDLLGCNKRGKNTFKHEESKSINNISKNEEEFINNNFSYIDSRSDLSFDFYKGDKSFYKENIRNNQSQSNSNQEIKEEKKESQKDVINGNSLNISNNYFNKTISQKSVINENSLNIINTYSNKTKSKLELAENLEIEKSISSKQDITSKNLFENANNISVDINQEITSQKDVINENSLNIINKSKESKGVNYNDTNNSFSDIESKLDLVDDFSKEGKNFKYGKTKDVNDILSNKKAKTVGGYEDKDLVKMKQLVLEILMLQKKNQEIQKNKKRLEKEFKTENKNNKKNIAELKQELENNKKNNHITIKHAIEELDKLQGKLLQGKLSVTEQNLQKEENKNAQLTEEKEKTKQELDAKQKEILMLEEESKQKLENLQTENQEKLKKLEKENIEIKQKLKTEENKPVQTKAQPIVIAEKKPEPDKPMSKGAKIAIYSLLAVAFLITSIVAFAAFDLSWTSAIVGMVSGVATIAFTGVAISEGIKKEPKAIEIKKEASEANISTQKTMNKELLSPQSQAEINNLLEKNSALQRVA